MTSALKIKANRANALAGTGPRTRQGKIRSAQNARRHGLSLSVLTDPLLSEDAENLARALAGEGASAGVLDAARRVAEAQIDLIRIRRARHDLLVRNLKKPTPPPGSDHPFGPQIRILEIFESAARRRPDIDLSWIGPLKQEFLNAQRDEAPVGEPPGPGVSRAILTDIPHEFAILDRYERRALSRRKFAIRELDALRQQTTA